MRPCILVCGATGFIGRNVLETLAARHEARVIGVWHRKPPFPVGGVTWQQGDLRSPDDAARLLAGVDVVVQAAAATSGAGDTVRAPHLHVTDNAVMNSILLRAAHEASVRQFLFFSCSIMYGSSPHPVREADFRPGDPIPAPYAGGAWTKIYIEQMCEFFARLGRTRFTVIRHANVYGPHDKYDLAHSHVFGATVTKVLEGEGPIRVWGDGTECRDLLYVGDLVDLVLRAVRSQSTPFELVNAGHGTPTSVADLVRRLQAAAGTTRDVQYDHTAPSIKTTVCLDSTRAKQVFGWEVHTSLEEGIARTLAWRRAALAAGRHGRVDVPA
jgi:nucleoside-diphosphate-sugar epimerase